MQYLSGKGDWRNVPPKTGETRRRGDGRVAFGLGVRLLVRFLVAYVEGMRNVFKADQSEESALIVRRVHVPAQLRGFRGKKPKCRADTHFVIAALVFKRFQRLVIPADGAMRGRNQAASSHNVGSNINTSGEFAGQSSIVPQRQA